MGAYLRWTLTDPAGTYTFNPNPNQMTTPFPARNISMQMTTAVDGQVLLFEGAKTPAQWTFGGDCMTAAQYEVLRSWVYDRVGRRVTVTDHYGRAIVCVLVKFDPVPKRAVGRYWRHTYEISAVVVRVGAPTVGEVPA